ncbi:high-affinity nicotinic acid transporter [Aureobasidium pullulans]|uniref:High-affinity nicotinic acid transporter n=1 Tax=Aureobasidium pullulans TaxID=5580 RepID=A0A4S9VFG3_AURPU|nr:high-affinity nicotinic acid transporter [Aureobasidium pullulans]
MSLDQKDGPQANVLPEEKTDASIGEVQDFSYDSEAERKVLRKFDKFLLPPLALILLVAYLDRSNLGNAKVFGFEDGIGLVGNQFNTISTLFYPFYVLFEIPWTMAVKRFGANHVLGIAMIAWSVITLCTGFIQTYHQAIAVRVLLGAFEAGLVPSIVMVSRVCGIESMGTQHGLESWRWLFIVEGAASIVICAICWALLPRNAETAWFLSYEEKAIMVARKQRNLVNRGTEEFSWEHVKVAFTDPIIYIASASFFSASIALFGFGTFLPTIIKGLGYTSLQANYLTIPVYIFATLTLITATFTSDRLQKRAIVLAILPIAPIIGFIIACSTASHAAGYFAMFLCGAGIYSYNCLILTWISTNLAPDYKRSMAMPFFVSLANISGVVSSQIYPSTDGPRYLMGNGVSAGTETLALCGVVAVWWTLRRRNLEKEKLRGSGVEDNGMDGDRALDFVYNL